MKDAMISVSKNNFGEFISTEWTVAYSQGNGKIRYYRRENDDDYYGFAIGPDS